MQVLSCISEAFQAEQADSRGAARFALQQRTFPRPAAGEQFLHKNYIVWHHQKNLTETMLEFITLCHSLVSGQSS